MNSKDLCLDVIQYPQRFWKTGLALGVAIFKAKDTVPSAKLNHSTETQEDLRLLAKTLQGNLSNLRGDFPMTGNPKHFSKRGLKACDKGIFRWTERHSIVDRQAYDCIQRLTPFLERSSNNNAGNTLQVSPRANGAPYKVYSRRLQALEILTQQLASIVRICAKVH